MPGPFLAQVDEGGAPKDVGAINNAIRSWHGPKLSAFSLCFRPRSEPTDWTLAIAALTKVADLLAENGAAVVVIDAARICADAPVSSLTGKPHVEIRGVIRGTP